MTAFGPNVRTQLENLLKKHWWKLLPAVLPVVVMFLISFLVLIYDMPVGESVGDSPPEVTVLHGAFHARAESPDGDSLREETLEAAAELGLDFVVLTAQGRELGPEELTHPGLLVVPATEVKLDGGRLLLFGEDAAVAPGRPMGPGAQELRARARARRVHVGVLSRPLSWFDGWDQREYSPSLRQHDTVPRVIDDVPRLGIEFLVASVEHENEFVSPYLPAIWYHWIRIFNGDYAAFSLYDRPKDALESWDDLSAGRPWPAPGFCATDAQHQLGNQERVLRTLGTYVHIPQGTPPEGRAAALEKSLRTGWHHCAVDLIGTAHAFDFRVVSKDGSRFWPMGDRVRMTEGLRLQIRAPKIEGHSVRVSIFRDGELDGLRPARKVDRPIEKPGVYRVEVDIYLDHPVLGSSWVPWIYSNPIKVTESAVPDLPAGTDPTVQPPSPQDKGE